MGKKHKNDWKRTKSVQTKKKKWADEKKKWAHDFIKKRVHQNNCLKGKPAGLGLLFLILHMWFGHILLQVAHS